MNVYYSQTEDRRSDTMTQKMNTKKYKLKSKIKPVIPAEKYQQLYAKKVTRQLNKCKRTPQSTRLALPSNGNSDFQSSDASMLSKHRASKASRPST